MGLGFVFVLIPMIVYVVISVEFIPYHTFPNENILFLTITASISSAILVLCFLSIKFKKIAKYIGEDGK